MDDQFAEISMNEELSLGDDFMMEMFAEIAKKVDQFTEYLEFTFKEK